MSSKPTRTAVLAVLLTMFVTLVGCGNRQSDSEADAGMLAGSCQPLPQPTVTADTPTIALLGIEGNTLTSYDQDTNVIIQAAKDTKARIIVNGVSDTANAPNLLSDVTLEGEGNNHLA